nr:histone deacetylase [uncultured Methanoregula sp.]
MNVSAITGSVFKNHDCKGHSECHDRLLSVLEGMPKDIPVYEPVRATLAQLERVHVPGYLKWLERQCTKHVDFCSLDEYVYTGGYFENNVLVPGYLDSNTYINPCSYEVATYAAGSAVRAVEHALSGERCFALVRPPGHHAEADKAMGFCLLNNTAVAAAEALNAVDRVAIIDWDAHHGNGTQSIFYDEGRVLYCSIHERECFPHTGLIEETGRGKGEGCTINAPLPRNSGIADFQEVFSEIFVPALRRYRPGLVIISAGQDTLADDPLGSMKLDPDDFGLLTHFVLESADCPLALVLEGGYGPSHAEAISSIFGVLLGKSPKKSLKKTPGKETLETVSLLKKLHRLST